MASANAGASRLSRTTKTPRPCHTQRPHFLTPVAKPLSGRGEEVLDPIRRIAGVDLRGGLDDVFLRLECKQTAPPFLAKVLTHVTGWPLPFQAPSLPR